MTAILTTLVLSAIFCGLYRQFAQRRQFLAIPNERSSHLHPTPSGGGVALLSAFTLGLLLSATLYGAWDHSFVALSVAALVLMVLGIFDDLHGSSVRLRLLLYSAICILLAAFLLHGVETGSTLRACALVLLAGLALLWSLNLYNFMDGIDGLAALQTVLAACSAALLSWLTGHGGHYALFCLLLAAAHCGFLVWNCPPARLFMGDAGSVPTGFILAALAVIGARQGLLNPLCWFILLAVFITDATWTLAWRMVSGQSFTQPHRTHAYQRLSRYWGSHLRVDMLLLAISTSWLLPLATAVQIWPDRSPYFVILAYLPLLCGMAKVGRLA